MNSKKKNSNKIPKTFFVSLGVAFFFWMLIKLSKEYKAVITFPISYINLPQDKLIQKAPEETIDIQLKASGFKLLQLQFGKREIELDTRNLKYKSGSNYYFLLKNQQVQIQNQISSTYDIDNILQDTIYLNLGVLTSKKIPVVGNFDFNYKLGYHLADNIKIRPDSILVSGPESQINTLEKLTLKKLKLENIYTDIDQKVVIETANLSEKIKFTIKEVAVTAKVSQFTEGNLVIPFTIINIPDSLTINTFPKSVEIKYQIELSRFKDVTKSSFKVFCDYQEAIKNGLRYMVPKIMTKPDFISALRITPEKIEFLIQK